MSNSNVVPSFCRNCLAYCPILVTVEDGRATKVTGDPLAPAFDGYSCPKGRALPEQHNDSHRLLHLRKRRADGAFATVAARDAVREVTAKVQSLLAAHGPRSIAMIAGTDVVTNPTSGMLARAWFRAIGSRMVFSSSTIDKPAEYTSTALHGNWVAGLQTFETADTWMIIGGNPVLAKSNGAPMNNPGTRLKQAVERGMKLIVIDPRRTETAKRAHVHLQIKPGEDPVVLAGIIRVVLHGALHAAAFVAEHARGLEALRAAVEPYTPDYVARRAGIEASDLQEAARCFAQGKRGAAVCSTGPSFATHKCCW
jgi:anaerobic selenocysteine-containing dehydrogenase